jgi:hypothetical protein
VKKIYLLIFFSLFISITLSFFVLQVFYLEQKISKIEDEKKYYESIYDIKNKIFIVGSSESQALNPFFIEELLLKNNEKYFVFNLSKGATHPQRYLETFDLLISAKPQVVVYGISARDFNDIIPSTENLPATTLLLDTSLIFQNSLNYVNTKFLHFSDDFIPKLITLKKIRGFTVNSQDYIKGPFIRFDYQRNFNTQSDESLKNSASFYSKIQFRNTGENQNILAFKQIIDKLKEKNIQIILFTTPQHKYAYDLVEKSDKREFEKILEEITEYSGLEIHSFTDKYSDMDVWRNLNHIVRSESSLIYSEDIGNLILQELN